MNGSKSDYIYPDLKGHKVIYKGKRFWIFEISKEFPFQGYEEFCDVIVYDKKDGAEMAGAKKTSTGFIGSLIGPRESIEVSGSSPIELLDCAIHYWRFYEKHFAGYISPSTPRVRKRLTKNNSLNTDN